MISRLLGIFKKPETPEVSSGTNEASRFGQIYELLFCDRPELFAPSGAPSAKWMQVLYEQTDPELIRALAVDPSQESRIRLLAFRWLSSHGIEIQSKEILGVVIEVGLELGNDTLAAYADGSVRYINRAGKLAVFDGGPPEVVVAAQHLILVSGDTVERIGPWTEPRLPPPSKGRARLTFLVADGLYFGEGTFNAIRNDPIGKPVIDAGAELLQFCVAASMATD